MNDGTLGSRDPLISVSLVPGKVGPKRIGIVLNGLEGKANTAALRFLILKMNSLQETFEYEFLPFFEDDLLSTLRSTFEVDRDEVKALAPAFQNRYHAHLADLNSEYHLKEPAPGYYIVICLATLKDNFYTTRRDGVSVIALGNWERHMAPPSIVEFLLTLVVREAVASVSESLRGSVHLGTKGCLFDFTLYLDDVRFKVLNAFVCRHCRESLRQDGLPALAAEIQRVLRKEWLGSASKPGTPAAIAARLGHDLFTTKGLQATRWEQFMTLLREEGTKQVLKILGLAVGAALLAWLGLKA
jgi:hypothetical protein